MPFSALHFPSNGGPDTANGNNKDRAAFEKLHQCPECLLQLTNPHQKQLHYHQVHGGDSRLTRTTGTNGRPTFLCGICERMMGRAEWRQHNGLNHSAGGGTLELPYACTFQTGTKRCKFRSSSRVVLIQHSIAEHPTLLFCPFCLATFSNACLPLYIHHILKHSSENHLQCTRCSLRFLVQNKEHYAKHANRHKQKGKPEWWTWSKYEGDLNDLNKLATVSREEGKLFSTTCFECQSILTGKCGHFSTQFHSCEKCGYGTNCALAFDRHQLLSVDCNPRNSRRWPFGTPPSNRPSSAILFTNKCQFSTINPQKMAEHFRTRWRHRPNEKILAKLIGPKRYEQEQDEAGIFGLTTLTEIPESNKLRALSLEPDNRVMKRKSVEMLNESRLEEFLRQDHLATVKKNDLLKRELLTNDNNKHPKDTLKAMRLALSIKPIFTKLRKNRKNFLREVL